MPGRELFQSRSERSESRPVAKPESCRSRVENQDKTKQDQIRRDETRRRHILAQSSTVFLTAMYVVGATRKHRWNIEWERKIHEEDAEGEKERVGRIA